MPSDLPQKLIRLTSEEVETIESLMARLRENGVLCRSWSDLVRLGVSELMKKYPPKDRKKR